MKRVFLVGTILASAAAGLEAMSPVPSVAERGSMLLIGVGLILTASLTRRRAKAR